jgi:hypothetical protein
MLAARLLGMSPVRTEKQAASLNQQDLEVIMNAHVTAAEPIGSNAMDE